MRILSQCWHLKLLVMSAAFDGQKFNNAQDDDWADDDSTDVGSSLELQAEHGLLPFIFDADDDSNSQRNGLPKELTLTPGLLSFFQQMFGIGRTEPWQRPSLHGLPRQLASAADLSVQCSCGMSFYYDAAKSVQSCPYCQEKPRRLLVAKSYYYNKQGLSEVVWTWVAPLEDGIDLRLPMRLSGSFEFDKHNDPMLEINQYDQDWFVYASVTNTHVDITDNNGHFRPLTNQRLLEKHQLREGVQLYLHAPYSSIIEIKVQGGIMGFKQLNLEVTHTFWIEPINSKGLTFTQGDLGRLRLSPRTGKLATDYQRNPVPYLVARTCIV